MKGLRAQKLPHTKEIAAKLITKMDRDDDNLISLEVLLFQQSMT